MKILMVNKFLYPNGGSETYIFKLGEQLMSLGHEVQYFGMEHEGRCVENHAQQYTADMDFHGGSKLKKLTYPVKTIYSAEAKRKMKIVLDDFQPDVIHINNFNYQLTPSILYAAQHYKKRAGKPVKIVYTAHDHQLICPNHLMFDADGNPCTACIGGKFSHCAKKNCIHASKAKSLIGTAEATLYKILGTYRYLDTIICCSESLKDKMDTNPIFAGKTVALHNFIEKQPKKEVKKENYALYFGRYGKEKGVALIPQVSDVSFICAGSGELEPLLDSAPNVKNVGFKTGEELEMLIRKAACSVCPSTCFDNCPFSVMESIMYGTPVVGADIGGIPELIEEGKTGVLFESGNSADFERAIKEAMRHSEEMSRHCFAAEFDTAQTYCDKLIKIYTS